MKIILNNHLLPVIFTLALTGGMCSGSIITGTALAVLYTICFMAFSHHEKTVLRNILYVAFSVLIVTLKIIFQSFFYAFFAAAAAIVVYLLYRKLNRTDTGSQRIGELLLILNPLIAFFFIELMNGKSVRLLFTLCYLWDFPQSPGYYFIGFFGGYVLLALLFLSMRFITGDRIGTVIVSIPVFLYGTVNHVVLTITGQPFLPSDLQIVGTAFGVLQAQTLPIASVLIIVITFIILCLYIAVILCFVPKLPMLTLRQRIKRVLCGMIAVYTIGVIGICISWGKDMILLYSGHKKYGAVINFILNLDYQIPFPDDVAAYLPEPDKDSVSDFKPNVIVVMNEAFSDLTGALELKVDQDPIPYFRSLCEAHKSGTAYSSVIGNNTCSSEWEFLSGTSTALTRKGSIIYTDNCVPMQTVVSAFNARGYTTTALHPYYGSGYNRKAVYEALGFDQVYFIEDLQVSSTDMIRDFASDQYCYDTLIDLYEQNGEEPFFGFCITMQNHADYLDDGGITPKISASGTAGTEYEYKLNRYLTLLGEGDRALQTLFTYFDKVDEPTVILFYGDHQPLLDRSIYTDRFGGESFYEMQTEDLTHAYEIPYLIWSNYDIGDVPEKTSMNYLSSVLFSAAGIELTDWMQRMESYRAAVPVLTEQFYMTAEGDLRVFNQYSVTEEPVLEEYQKYCYGVLYGMIEARKTDTGNKK